MTIKDIVTCLTLEQVTVNTPLSVSPAHLIAVGVALPAGGTQQPHPVHEGQASEPQLPVPLVLVDSVQGGFDQEEDALLRVVRDHQ